MRLHSVDLLSHIQATPFYQGLTFMNHIHVGREYIHVNIHIHIHIHIHIIHIHSLSATAVEMLQHSYPCNASDGGPHGLPHTNRALLGPLGTI